KFCRSSGYQSEELLGRRIASLFGGSRRQQAFETMIESVARGEVWHGELAFTRSDYQNFQTSATISTLAGSSGANTQVLMLLAASADPAASREPLFRRPSVDTLTALPNRQLAVGWPAQAVNAADRHGR